LGTLYVGTTSTGGTIELALTDDQSSLLWYSVEDLYYPTTDPMAPCGSGSRTGTWQRTPPLQITNPNFTFAIPFFHAQANFQGTIESASDISGTSTFSTFPIGCPLATINWSVTAVGSTSPAKLDREYNGSIGGGEMTMWVGSGGTIQALAMDDVEQPSGCPYEYWNAVTLRAGPQLAPIDSGLLELDVTYEWAAVYLETTRPNLASVEATLTIDLPDGQGQYCELTWKGVLDGDTDGDDCIDVVEEQTGLGTELSGGRRDPDNSNDYFNPSHDGQNRIDDVLEVVNQYFIDSGEPGYNPDTDRTFVGPLAWNLGPPDGLQRVDDILNQVKQYFHDCA
jgi:hypothetical protein